MIPSTRFKLFFSLVLALALMFPVAGAVQSRSLPDFVPLAEANSPAVVNISTSRTVESRMGRGHPPIELPDGLPQDGPFGDLLRRFFGEEGQGAPRREFDSRSLGSGFIISDDGYVVTNHHVVKDADQIEVRLSDRRTFEAELVGSDPRTDVALLRIDATDLPTLKLGDSEDLKVGEWVLAIGSPFGFDHSVTAGIISAKGRSLPTENYVPFLQTDVAINPGNSGGPLFNLDGEVVGINSQIYSRTGGFMGLSFAIPIEVAMDVVDQLRETGRVSRGWLGVMIQEVTRDLADSFDMDRPMGALVARVLPDSPAEAAGLKSGDVIVGFAGEEVPRSSALPPMVGRFSIGETAEVDILRDGAPKSLSVKIARLPENDGQARAHTQAPVEPPSAAMEMFGMDVGPVPDDIRERLDLPEGGVLVKDVAQGAAQRAGIRSGDVLLMINSHALESPEQMSQVIEDLPAGRSARVLVQRRQGPIWMPLEVPE
ncbi:DegQ family serine endoprotease [Ectothiorhodospira variabilis]|uniref:DegQ family serine endoprotease n=1 Tax=Ectothiorhodospira variabilis TaxID=505694 RepID=UPI001EFC1B96|nr:DegQ family serine endoprotease [Ectothiorhodospira variabilis]MCG5493931.1 DegQ family serine endoprotease [Ectothiorhodospira variabilis]MCG5498145.1 DegQ family serine endoprotease [Ectothiorhodospira variabilis]MCG5503734.1 DegQ family serine endoprotease [Ectothiorhodospira variabilis]MCG5506890.1 DegQ family serine endoprotease [Ectothiorhodospira variabilis]